MTAAEFTDQPIRDESGRPLTGEDGPEYLTTAEVARLFRTSPSSVREWRQKGAGPVGIRFGRRVLYPVPEIVRFQREQLAAARTEHRALKSI